jgi:hypothetical protein
VRASGQAGELRVCYQHAAWLGAWTLAVAPGATLRCAFEAQVLSENRHWMSQEPLDLVLAVGTAEWVWRGVQVRRAGDKVEIDLTERPIVTERAGSARESASL